MTDDRREIDEAQRATSGSSAADLRREIVTNEVIETQREVKRVRFVSRISQVVDYIFFLIYGLLTVRLLLALLAARESAGFVQFIRSATDWLYAPFRGIVASPTTPEGTTLALPIVVAIVAYMLLHLAIHGLLRILAQRRGEF